MIVYKREVKKEDILNLGSDEELIYYKDNNIAYLVNHIDGSYVVRKKKIFNSQILMERILKTVEQVVKNID